MNQYQVLILPSRTHQVDRLTGQVQRTKATRKFFNTLAEAYKFRNKQRADGNRNRMHIVDQSLRMTIERS